LIGYAEAQNQEWRIRRELAALQNTEKSRH
jgi:hypothetical protein